MSYETEREYLTIPLLKKRIDNMLEVLLLRAFQQLLQLSHGCFSEMSNRRQSKSLQEEVCS